MRYSAPVAGYDWLDPDPTGGIDTGRRYAAPAQGVDPADEAWNEARRPAEYASQAFEDGSMTAAELAERLGVPESHIRSRPAEPGDPVYDFLAGTRDSLPAGWPDEPTDEQLDEHARQAATHGQPANLDEQRTAIEAAADQLATGYAVGNGPLTPERHAELADVAAPPDWAIATDEAIAAGASVPWAPGERDIAFASGLPPELVHRPGATLEVMRFEPVRYSAPAILDRTTGEVISPKLAAKRQRLIDAVKMYAAADPRSQQAAIGPSEIGDPCDSRVLRKLLGFPAVATPDPWASFVGTAVHAKLAEVFAAVNASYGVDRYLIERRVWPTEHISGSTDLAELVHWSDVVGGDPGMVVDIYDHKIMGVDGFALVKKDKLAPGTKYGTQIDIYAKGWRAAGYTVRSVNLAAWKRSGFLDDLLVIEREPDYANADLAIERLEWLRTKADMLNATDDDAPWADGRIETSPGKGCGFCPYYSPTLPTGRGSCDRGRDYMAGAKAGKGPRGATT